MGMNRVGERRGRTRQAQIKFRRCNLAIRRQTSRQIELARPVMGGIRPINKFGLRVFSVRMTGREGEDVRKGTGEWRRRW